MKGLPGLTALALCVLMSDARADVVSDWNLRCHDLIAESRLGTPPAVRVMAIAQTAAFDAVNAITRRYPAATPPAFAAPGASIDAAVAAAHRTALLQLLPMQQASIDAAYQAAVDAIADGAAKENGIAVGRKAAAEVLARRLDDGAAAAESYRPHAGAGAYVPTAAPATPHWSGRKPWLMASSAQFRPAAPPALTSQVWADDYAEVKSIGARSSDARSAEQTEIARFWEYSSPALYDGVVRSVALQPGREVTRNARLFALTAQAMDDALIAVFDAKYRYHFWRPVTAIRNGDIDGHDDTQREPSWLPLIEAPLNPDYPSAQSTLASTVATLLKVEIGAEPMPVLATASPSADGAARHWANVDEFVREVSDSRVYAGVHFRAATQAGEAMGRRIGELAGWHLQ